MPGGSGPIGGGSEHRMVAPREHGDQYESSMGSRPISTGWDGGPVKSLEDVIAFPRRPAIWSWRFSASRSWKSG